MKKRILSVLLVLSMMLGVMNVTAFASEESPGENNSENIESGTAFDVNTESVDIKNTDDENNIQNANTEHVHAYGEPMWSWNDYHATAAFTCTCGDVQTIEATVTNEVTTAATETVPGVRTYTAAVTFLEREYVDIKTEDIQATGIPSPDDTLSISDVDSNLDKNIELDQVEDNHEDSKENENEEFINNSTLLQRKSVPEVVTGLEEAAPKFKVEVSSRLNNGSTTTVTGTVDADYNAKLVLPASETYVNAGNATVCVEMTNVDSLGVAGTKSHQMTLSTGLDQIESALSAYVRSLYNFQDASITATIKNGNDDPGKTASYTLSRAATQENDGTVVITGTTNTVATREAWQYMINGNIEAGSKAVNDSYINIANGSWMQIGNQKLEFETSGDLRLDNIANLETSTITDAVKLTPQDTSALSFYLAAGTELAVSNSYAKLLKDVTVTVGSINASELNDVLPTIQTIVNDPNIGTAKGLVLAMVGLLDAIVGQVDTADNVGVEIVFTEPVEEAAPKFKVEVSSRLNNGSTTTVTGTVDADYNAKLVLPASGTCVNAGNATVYVEMTNVDSLGIAGTKSHQMTLSTGLDQYESALSAYVSSLYSFQGASVTATIKNGNNDPGKTASYTLSGAAPQENGTVVITGTTDTVATREAWQYMINGNIEAGSKAVNDSYINIANGSWMQIGNQKLEFETSGDLKLDNIANLETSTITDAVKLTPQDTSALSFYLAAGTELAVSNSYAKLLKDVTVTVGSINASELNDVLPTIQTIVNDPNIGTAKGLVLAMVGLLDAIVGQVDAADNVGVEIVFTEPVEEAAPKFKVEVTSILKNSTTTTVTGTVDADYNAKLVLPASGTCVNAGNATVYVEMTNVDSLGVAGTKSHQMTLSTGLDQFESALSAYVSSLYSFQGASVTATIKNGSNDFGKTASYTLSGAAPQENGTVVITGTTDTVATREAWQYMINGNIEAGSKAVNDSYINIANGSWMQIGNQKLEFETSGDLKLDNIANLETSTITDAVKLTPQDTSALSFYLAAGTELAVSNSYAKLLKDVTVTVGSINASELNDVLPTIQTIVNDPNIGTAKGLVLAMVGLLDAIVGQVDAADNVSVEIVFGCEHKYSNPQWSWNDDYTSATATFTCTCACGCDHTESVFVTGEAIINDVTTQPTEEADGEMRYTATVVFEGKKYTDQKTCPISALGHKTHVYGAPTWIWNSDHTTATATFICTYEGCTDTQDVTVTGDAITSEITRSATETTDGERTYTATVTFDGKTYTDTTTETIPALSHTHSYSGPVWSWNGATATAAFTCDCGDTQTVIAAVASAVTTPATATTNGVRTYTATVAFNGNTYTTSTTATIPATGTGTVVPTVPDTSYYPNTYSTPNTSSIPNTSNTPANPPVEITDLETPLTDRPFPFVDVTVGDWFYEDVKSAYEMYLMEGISDTRFDPQGNTTRGMVAMILYRMEGEPNVTDYSVTIPDLKDNDWYHDAAIWAYATGAYEGYEDGSFRGDDLVTRQQLATVLYRYATQKGYDVSAFNDLSVFVDKDDVSNWALEGVQWSVGAELIKGRDGNRIAPAAHTTRAELATILVRFVDQFDAE